MGSDAWHYTVVAWVAFSRPKLVPRGLQNAGEYAYLFVRDQIARPSLGADADRWMSLLLTLFLLVLLWNVMGVLPLLQFPVTAHVAFPWVLAGVVYVIKLYVGFTRQRLFANMFAGHTLLAFFSAVGYWFLVERPTVAGVPVGVLGVFMTCVLTAFEIFVMFLQAYLFTMLTAMYLGQSLHPEH